MSNSKNNNINNIKKIVFLLILLIIVILIIVYFLNNKSKGRLKASIIGSNSNQKLTLVASYKTIGSNSNALQGGTGYNNEIYFSTTKSGADKKKNYYSSIKLYDLSNKKTPYSIGFNQILSQYPTYKVNDITTNTTVGRNYYLAYDAANGKKSKIIFSTNNIIRELSTDVSIANIAYNSSNKKYYSIRGTNLYKYDIPSVAKTNTSKNLGNIKLSKACNIKHDSNITSQGITMRGYLLFYAYQKHPKTNQYTNFISVYNTRNCKSGSTLSPIQTLSFGTCTSNSGVDNCEMESLFYMNSKLYLGYNNSSFNGINFYRLDFPNNNFSTSINIKSVKNEKVTIQGYAKSGQNKIYSYKFCTNKTGTDCNYVVYKNAKNEYITEKNIKVSYTINKNNSDWYFFVKDIFGNVDSAKISKSDIQKALKK